MKKLLVLGLGCLVFFSLGSNTATNSNWVTSYAEAVSLSKSHDKPILLSFAGSDWCKPCIKLTKEVFDTSEFAAFAEDNLVLLLADFPRLKKNQLSKKQSAHNERLAAKYNRQGLFPWVVMLNQEGEVLGALGYESGGPEKYIPRLQAFMNK